MMSDKRWVIAGVLGAAVITLPLALAPVSASASGKGTATTPHVTGGISAKFLPGAKAFGTTPATTEETVSIILKDQNLSGLENAVDRGMQSYLSVAQFAATYGQSPRFISQLESYLGHFGITSSVYPDDVDVKASGTAGEFDAAFSVHQRQYRVPGHRGQRGAVGRTQTIHSPTGPPELPSSLADNVVAILGLDDYAPYVSEALPGLGRSQASSGTETAGCAMATAHLVDADGCHTPAYFATQYGLGGPYSQGAKGQGVTLGIVTLAGLNTTAPTTFWRELGIHTTPRRTITVVNVDGGPPVTASTTSGETDLDTEQSGAVAPDADIVVYQAPNTTSGFVDAFFTAASANAASSVSVGWGLSETVLQAEVDLGYITRGYVSAFDEAFLELAAQGESAFASSGDTGAYDAFPEIGTTNLSVDNPGDSPYVTAAGGTTTPFSAVISSKATPDVTAPVSVSTQRTWGWDYLWSALAAVTHEPLLTAVKSAIGGSGGGYSALEPTPSYQVGVPGTQRFSDVDYLTPTDYTTIAPGLSEPIAWSLTPTPTVGHGFGTGRAMPDVSADADPLSGYLLYGPTTAHPTTLVLDGDWGGTSFVAPQLNGSTAVIDSALGRRVGFWNPSIYAFATGRNSPFTPLDQPGTTNDNLYYTGTPGTVYNPGSGLGYPNLTKLEADFAGR